MTKNALYFVVIIKLLQLCLIICCIGLIDEPASHSQIRSFITPRVIHVCYATFGCMMVYSTIFIMTAMFGDMTSWKTATLWSLVGFVFFVVTTILLFRDWGETKERNFWQPNMQRLDLVLATASTSLVTAVFYLVDLLMTTKFGMQGDLE